MDVRLWPMGEEEGDFPLLGTGGFYAPLLHWRSCRSKLEPLGNGFLRLKKEDQGGPVHPDDRMSNIYSQEEKVRRIHTLILPPQPGGCPNPFLQARKSREDFSDGRPIFGFSAKDLARWS